MVFTFVWKRLADQNLSKLPVVESEIWTFFLFQAGHVFHKALRDEALKFGSTLSTDVLFFIWPFISCWSVGLKRQIGGMPSHQDEVIEKAYSTAQKFFTLPFDEKCRSDTGKAYGESWLQSSWPLWRSGPPFIWKLEIPGFWPKTCCKVKGQTKYFDHQKSRAHQR